MADGRNQNLWALASAVLCLLANCHRDPKKRAFTPDEFNPTVDKRERTDVVEVTPETMDEFRDAFVGMKPLVGVQPLGCFRSGE